MTTITYENLKATAKIAKDVTGLDLNVTAGNGCYGLQIKKGHGYEWILNGMTKPQLASAIWGIIRTVKEIEERNS